MQPAPKLLEVILQNCRGRVDECLPLYLQASPYKSLLFVSAAVVHPPLWCTHTCVQLATALCVLHSDYNAYCASTCVESNCKFESPQGMPHYVNWCLHAAHPMMLTQLPTASFHAMLAPCFLFAACRPCLMCRMQTMHWTKILCPMMPLLACCSAAHVPHTCRFCSKMEWS